MALDSKQISDKIKIFRKEQKLSQGDFAARVGHKWHQIKDMETYTTKPSVEMLAGIVSAFGVSGDRFLMELGVPRTKSKDIIPLIEKQFPFLTGIDIEGWTEDDYIRDRVKRQQNDEINREQRILEYLAERPEIKEELYQKAVSLETIVLKERLIEKIEKLDKILQDQIVEGFCLSEEEDAVEIIRRLDMKLLYVVAGRYREVVTPQSDAKRIKSKKKVQPADSD